MRVFVFNVLKSLLELLLHAYVPWLDPLHYLDLSRSALLAERGYVNVRRRVGPMRLPLVWHDGSSTNVRAFFLMLFSVLVFILNQAALDVDTSYVLEPASVLTCDDTKGEPNLLNSRKGITHLLRTIATCGAGRGPGVPRWGDGRVKSGKVMFGSNSYRCRDPLDDNILRNSNYCYNGNFVGNACSGNFVNNRPCGLRHESIITHSGIKKQGNAILCSAEINSTGTLFWVGNSTWQGVLFTGVEGEFRPVTLEIIRRTMSGPDTFRRTGIMRALDAEATLRDRPLCRWGVPGYVQTRNSYSVISIHQYWWFMNLALGVFWWWNSKKPHVGRLDFTATGCVDRLRAEAAGTGCAEPPARNFVFGVVHGSHGALHLGPAPGGMSDVVHPEQWEGRKIHGRRRRRHGKTWMSRMRKLQRRKLKEITEAH